jgi:type I restriction enzyme S subunit
VTLCDEPFWPIDTAFFIRDEPRKRDLHFTYYLLKTLGLEHMNTDCAVPGLNRENAHALVISVPKDVAVQKQLAKGLKLLDDRIALLSETNTTLETIAQSLFKSWFVDFDPTRAKAKGRDYEGVPPEVSDPFPSEFEGSTVGEIPKGWRVGRLGDLIELAYGKALKATDRRPGYVPVYGSGGVTGFHDTAYVDGPSIIVGRKGTVGSLYWEDRPFFPIDTVFFVKPRNMPLTYCYYTMQRLGLENMNTDAAVPGLNRENAYRLPVVLATQSIVEAFDGMVSALRARIRNGLEQQEALASLRDTLLPRLMSGKLRIPESQEAVEEATP